VELDLSYTLVSEWGEVMEMCAHLPKLERFQLSHNRFKPLRLSPISTEMDVQFPHLHALILHNTALPWSEVLTICSFFPALEELHFSLNKLQKFDTDHNEKGVSTSMESEWERLALLFPSLRVLNLTENEIDDWTQVSYFKCLPRLEQLLLSQNKIANIQAPTPPQTPPAPSGAKRAVKSSSGTSTSSTISDSDSPHIHFSAADYFPQLKVLFLDNNRISDWSSVDALNQISSLRSLRLRWNPINETVSAAVSRIIVTARLPALTLLNGSEV